MSFNLSGLPTSFTRDPTRDPHISNKPNAAGVSRCLLKNLTSDLEKWVKVTGNVNLSEIFYRYIFGINLRSLRDFVIELTRSQVQRSITCASKLWVSASKREIVPVRR